MREHKFYSTIGDEVNASVTFTWSPAEPATRDYPGCDAELDIESVLVDNDESKNITDALSEYELKRLYKECETWDERQEPSND